MQVQRRVFDWDIPSVTIRRTPGLWYLCEKNNPFKKASLEIQDYVGTDHNILIKQLTSVFILT